MYCPDPSYPYAATKLSWIKAGVCFREITQVGGSAPSNWCYQHTGGSYIGMISPAGRGQRCAGSQWCNDGDVRVMESKFGKGVEFTPEVYRLGRWHPVCGHEFWDNHFGANVICRMLGFGRGTAIKARTTFTTDAMPVGRCADRDPSLSECKEGKGHFDVNFKTEDGGSCKAGSKCGVKVQCEGGNHDNYKWASCAETGKVNTVSGWKKFHNLCVAADGTDLPPNVWIPGNSTLDSCKSQCSQFQDCSAIEWYPDGKKDDGEENTGGARCFLTRTAQQAIKGKAGPTPERPGSGRRNDVECHIKPVYDFGYADKTCDETLRGKRNKGYVGCQTITRKGYTCQAWNHQRPHTHSYLTNHQHNYCRNPSFATFGKDIWCYTTSTAKRWDYCYPIPKRKHQSGGAGVVVWPGLVFCRSGVVVGHSNIKKQQTKCSFQISRVADSVH